MARSIWKGNIAFGLVQIPVALHSAEEPNELNFDLLDKRDLSPVGYQRVNKRTGKKVEWNTIVKGYEYRKGEYVVVTDQDFEEANVEATHTIDIDQVVDLEAVDPKYFERPYYVAPTKGGEKAYVLLRETLAKSGKVAVCKVVIRTRQHLALVMPQDDVLVLMILRFDHELRKPEGLDIPKGDLKKLGVSPRERQMAETLVASLEGKWQPEQYKDTYRDDLLHRIKERAKRGEVNQVPEVGKKKPAPKRGAQIIDLAALLAQSVEASKKPARSSSKRKTKSAPRKATADHSHSTRKSA